ncbi:MAG: helix-turn-helix domain-containing protein [Alphaproteobacteria bacterium]
MTDVEFTIGHLAKTTGCKVPTIRYYEQIGLLPTPQRSTGNHRLYGPEHLNRLAFIRHCRQLGFSQSAIRELLELTDNPDQPCDAVTRIASAHLEQVNKRMARLMALKAELERMIESCGDRKISNCRIVETLADQTHEHCISDRH